MRVKSKAKTGICFLLAGLLLGGAIGNTASEKLTISFDWQRLATKASNQFAVWIEDNDGRYITTVAATRFTARGGFERRPDSLPGWIAASRWADSTAADVDAVSTATPETGAVVFQWDGKDSKGKPVPPGVYKYVVEGSIFWDGRVVWTGTVNVGGGPATSAATADYLPNKVAATEKGLLITNVKASYK